MGLLSLIGCRQLEGRWGVGIFGGIQSVRHYGAHIFIGGWGDPRAWIGMEYQRGKMLKCPGKVLVYSTD